MYRGNKDRVMADGEKIADRLRKHETKLTLLMAEYHCGYGTIMKVVLTYISTTEWQRIRHGNLAKGGIKTRLKKGHVPWNKGLHYNPGGRSAQTRFRPGHIRGSAARRYKPVGTITIRKDKPPKHLRCRKRREGLPPWPRNYHRYIKIRDTGPPQYCWIPYARYLWEQANGTVSKGTFVVHVDGNTLNDSLDNLRCVDRKGHLALQLKRDPNMRRKMIENSARTRRKNRAHKGMVRKCEIARRRSVFWQCTGCGKNYYQDSPPSCCTKCVGHGFERIVRKVKVSA